MKRLILICAVLLAVAAMVVAADPKKPADHGLFLPDQIQWMDAPNALPAGSKLAVLEGNPFKHELYTMRLRMPDGYKIPPHTHTAFEHVTVISGTFNLGMGGKFDAAKGTAMPPDGWRLRSGAGVRRRRSSTWPPAPTTPFALPTTRPAV